MQTEGEAASTGVLSAPDRLFRAFTYAVMVAWAAFALMPIVFMFVSAFKPVARTFLDLRATNPLIALLPTEFTTENFVQVFLRTPFARFLFNSMTVAAVSV